MSTTIDFSVESPRWDNVTGAQKTIRAAIEAALESESARETGVSVVLTDDARMRALNRAWRGKDAPTNVLSFPAAEDPHEAARFLGDIVLAIETIEREAADECKPLSQHLAHLAVHGTLHLLGFDHERDEDADTMERREREILAALGVPDPYAATGERSTEPA
ncbi:MAG: rRNA maturation RNase YbeY [Bradyrhizobiaceae bacterium]|nr:rRNA maturation RNase YbeY [Bradyrhizobiaceae bacterium]